MSTTEMQHNAANELPVETDSPVGWSFLRSRRWLGYFALLLIFSIACVLLGNWQFMRRAEAQAEIARIDAHYDSSPRALTAVMPDPLVFDHDSMKWQPVELHGEYFGDTLLARNRPSASGVGSNLVQGFRLESGAVIFIDRGWVPVAGIEEIPASLPTPPSGDAVVFARLLPAEPQIPGRTSTGRLVASINPFDLAQQGDLDGDVYLAAYGQLISEQPGGETGTLTPRPERDEGPHLSYALQWYVFIVIAAAGVFYAARLEHRGLNPDGELVIRDRERNAERKRRRGPSDADEEDALLDA